MACTESGFEINGPPIDNGNGTWTINVTGHVATNNSATGSLGPTGGIFWGLPACNILNVVPMSLTSANGSVANAIIAGGTVTFGTPAGPFSWILNTDPQQAFPFTVIVDCNPEGMMWQGGGQESNACQPTTPPSSFDYNGVFPCILPTVSVAGPTDITICEGEPLVLSVIATGEDMIIWSPNGETGSTISVNPTTTTTYTATASNNCGSELASITVTVNPLPTLVPPIDQIICIGESIFVDAGAMNTDQIVWLPVGTSGPVLNDTPTQTTTYTVTGSNPCGVVSYSFTVEVIQLPELFLIQGGQTICPGDPLELIVEAFNEDFLTWIPTGEITPTIFVNPPISSVFTATASNFCGAVTIDIPVDVIQPPLIIPQPDQTICEGEDVTLTIDAIDATLYEWDPINLFDQTVTVSPTTTTTYVGTASNACGGTTDTIVVDVNTTPELDVLMGNQDFCDGNDITFSVDTTNATSILWTPGGSTATSITISPTATTTYSVMVTNECGDTTIDLTATLIPDFQVPLTIQACQGFDAIYNGTNLAIGSVTDFTFTSALGCDSTVTVTVEGLDVLTSTLPLETCDGTTADYNGNALAIGTSTDFTFTSSFGCDSIVTVVVGGLPNFTESVVLEACDGTTADYNGNALAIGSSTDFMFTAENGCDSTVTVMVDGLDVYAVPVNLDACENSTATYNGTPLNPGTVTDFMFTAANGCDSVVTVTVDELSTFATPISLDACDGTTADYNGNALAIGSTTDFIFPAANGCDSTVTVTVNQLDVYMTPLTLEACDGTTADYNGNALAIGSTTDFVFPAANGCDSTVTVMVDQLDTYMTPLSLDACTGTTADYNGNALAIGSTTDFVFPAANGCDSTVTVTVDELNLSTFSVNLEACDGNTADYNGNALAIGSTTDFVFPAANGCDSTVTVMVDGLDVFASDLTLETCAGTQATYQGSSLSIGSMTDFTLTAQNGCDSVVTVMVDGIDVFTSDLNLETCDGTTATYQGTSLAIGSSTDFTLTSVAGCDSIVTVTVDGISAFLTTVNLEACNGTTADYNGTPLAAGSSTDFMFFAASGCDSIVTVEVEDLPVFATPIMLEACDGNTADYNGNMLSIGSTTDFPFTAANGCDSIVTVEVMGLPVFSSPLNLQTCIGTDITYQGTTLSAGSVTDFTLTAQNGCDSVVTVSVDGIPILTSNLTLETCLGTDAIYQGTSLAIGSSTDFNFTSSIGCDSIVTVTVDGIDEITSTLSLETCDGTTATYQGTSLAIGSITEFILIANNGCDSTVTVDVGGIPILTAAVQLETCDGTTADYIGNALAIGSSTDFTFTSSLGCDSIVTVDVDGIPILTESIQLETCDGTTADYNGNALAVGSSTDFTFTSSLNCDSIVTVDVAGLPNTTANLQLQTCDGTETTYQGTSLAIGSITDFTLTATNGCDSIVTVNVIGLSILTSSLQLEACDGTEATYQGSSLAIGSSTDFTFTSSSGCDSIVTVSVAGLQNYNTPLMLDACDGTTADYNGSALAVGSTTDFLFPAANGCDSTVTVMVNGLEVFASTLDLETCDGTTATYQGSDLIIGSSTPFTLTAQNGCDSVVTVNVAGLQNYMTPLTLETCEGTTATYQGSSLDIGTTTPFSFIAANGCDSTVMVSVAGLEIFASDLPLQACEGTTAFYNGQSLDIGSSTPFTLTAQNGCDSVVTVSVEGLTVYEEDLVILTCEGSPLVFDGQTIPPGTNLPITYTSALGCDSIVTVFAEDVLPLFSSNEDIVICSGESTDIFGQSISIPGAYPNTFAAANGCDSIHTIVLDVLAPISIDPVTEASCQDVATGEASITASGGLEPFSYQWSNGGATTSIEGVPSGTYTVSITDDNGCTETLTIPIAQHDIALSAAAEDVTCFEYTDGTIIVDTPDPTWTMSLEGTVGSNPTGIFGNLPSGNYTLITQDEFGCIYENPFTINQPAPLIVDLPNDTTIRLGAEVPVNANFNWFGPLVFDWNSNEFFINECDNCDGGLTRPLQNIEYVLTITNEDGCVATDQMNIIVENPFDVYIPNIFSPNGDGINDVFMIFSSDDVARVTEFKVFSRWGELIFQDFDFQTNDPTHSWDGIFLDQRMNPAVFVYFAEIEFIDGQKKLFKGDVTLAK